MHVGCLTCYFSSLSQPYNFLLLLMSQQVQVFFFEEQLFTLFCDSYPFFFFFFFQSNEDHCLLLALPCGRDPLDVHKQTRALKSGFINYLQQKQAAGIINVARPGSTQVNVPWENWFYLNYHHEQFGKVMFQVCAFVRVNGLANT